MNSASNAVQELRSISNPPELDLLGLLLSDSCVTGAIRELDRRMLQSVFGVSVLSFEDHLKDRYGVVFRNYPGHFEILQGKESLLKVEDDTLGSVGLSLVQRAMTRSKTSLMSYYLAGRRSRDSVQEIASGLDVVGIRSALPQIKSAYAYTKKAVEGLVKHDIDDLPLPDACDDAQLAQWHAYLSRLMTLLSQLRTNPAPIYVTDKRVRQQEAVTVGQLIRKGGELGRSVLRPRDGDRFTEAELNMIQLLDLEGFETVEHEGVQYQLGTNVDVFTYVGSLYIAPPELPDWTKPCVSAPVSAPSTPTRVVSPTHAPPDAEPESIIRDYYGLDLNRFRDVSKQLLSGGLTQDAKTLWSSLSKSRQGQLLRCIEGPISFRAAVQDVATVVDLPVTEALAEVVASKLVLAKSAFKIDKSTMTVRRV